MKGLTYPSLYQINTRVWMTELARDVGRSVTLDDITDSELDRLAGMGFDWVWLLSVWQTGQAGRQISRTNPEWRKEFRETLPDLTEQDIPGSGFAITGYTVHERLGGDAALDRLRERLRQRGLKLMLDFVPNHTALDHPWVDKHPEYYILGREQDLVHSPQNYTWIRRSRGDLLLAYGRDPSFPGWPDTLQLNYGNPATQEALISELMKVADRCDGVRCDMAMLVLPEVFERTWGISAKSFWPDAIHRVREKSANFCFLAEVYWDLEWAMQQQGFDYAYDKRLYDRLRAGGARTIREHLRASLDYQNKLARFLENHDEARAATAFKTNQHEAAAVITYLSPGLRFFHQGQLQGRQKRISPHLGRGPKEPVNECLKEFYTQLLELLRQPVVHDGRWQLLECAPAWEGNGSNDAFVIFAWQDDDRARLLVAVNYSCHASQCYVRPPLSHLGHRQWRFNDLLSKAAYVRDGNDLETRGLYLDLAPWEFHTFEISPD
jgi:hypothetical protein